MPLLVRERLLLAFPESEPSRWPRRALVCGYSIAAALIVLCALARQPGVPATSSVWAEDGEVLYQAAIGHSLWVAVGTPYDGYLQLVPRLAVEPATLFPPSALAVLAAITGDLILAFCALIVFHAARGLLPGVASRALLVASMVLLPVAGGELLNDLIGTLWWLLFASFWVLLWRPATRGERLLAAGFCFLAAASTPATALYAPLLLARALALPRRRDHAASAGLLAGLAVQVPAIAMASGGGSVYPHSTSHILSLFAIRVGAGTLAGVGWLDQLIASAPTAAVVLGAAVLAAVVAIVVAVRSARVGVFAALALPSAAVLFGVELWYRGAGLWMNAEPAIYGGRYVQTPLLLVLSVLVVCAERSPAAARRIALALLAACLLPSWVHDFRAPNWRASGPDWGAAVARAERACATARPAVVRIDQSPAGWSVRVPCGDLR